MNEPIHGRADHWDSEAARGWGHEAGVKTADLCREHGIRAGTFYAWKAKFGGMEVGEAQRLKQLEEENRRGEGSS